jgi:hypothetical protein
VTGVQTCALPIFIVAKVGQRKKLDGFNDDGESW